MASTLARLLSAASSLLGLAPLRWLSLAPGHTGCPHSSPLPATPVSSGQQGL